MMQKRNFKREFEVEAEKTGDVLNWESRSVVYL